MLQIPEVLLFTFVIFYIQIYKLYFLKCSAAYRSGPCKQLVYSFTRIFEEAIDQNRIFEDVGAPLVQDLLAGKNGTL